MAMDDDTDRRSDVTNVTLALMSSANVFTFLRNSPTATAARLPPSSNAAAAIRRSLTAAPPSVDDPRLRHRQTNTQRENYYHFVTIIVIIVIITKLINERTAHVFSLHETMKQTLRNTN